jgi:hypothetical protein
MPVASRLVATADAGRLSQWTKAIASNTHTA